MSTKRFQQLIPSLHNGISRQAPPIRFSNQVSDAENVLFSILDGALKRPGTRFHSSVTMNKGDSKYRVHKVQRDQNEKYLFTFGAEASGMSFRALQTWNPRNRIQWVTILNSASTTGSFKLQFGGQVTADILNSATPATVSSNILTALENLSTVGAFRVTCENANDPDATRKTYVVVFDDDLVSGNLMVVSAGTSNDISASVSVIGSQAKIIYTGSAQTYIQSLSPTADDLRLLTITDTTVICNKKVATGTVVGAGHTLANTGLDPAKMPVKAVRTSLTPPTFTISPIAWSAAPQAWRQQKVYVSLTTGNYTLTFDGQTTAAINWNATSAEVRNALVNLSNIGAQDVDVIKVDNVYSVFFTNPANTLTGAGLMTTNGGTNVTINFIEEQEVAPDPIIEGLKIVDVIYHRGRLGFALGEWIIFSQPDDLFNFFPEANGDVSDADNISLQIGADTVSLITYAVPFRKGVLILTEGGRQFDLGSSETFTAETASFTPSTQYTTQNVRPAATGDTIYFAGVRESSTPVWEYTYDDVSLSNKAQEISSHVADLIPQSIKTVVASDNNSMVFVLPLIESVSDDELQSSTSTGGNWDNPSTWVNNSVPGPISNVGIAPGATVTFTSYPTMQSNTILVYRQYVAGEDKVQSAWSVYTFGTDAISDIAVIDDTLWICRINSYGSTNQIIFESMPISPIPSPPSGFPFQPRLDHRHVVKGGTFDSTNTNYDLMSYDPLVDTACWVDSTGKYFEAPVVNLSDAGAGTTLLMTTNVNTSALLVTFGRKFHMNMELSQIFAKDQDKSSVIDGHVELSKVVVSHQETGEYSLNAQTKNGLRTVEHRPDFKFGSTTERETLSTSGRTTSWLMGRSLDNVISIDSYSSKPTRLTSVEYHGRQTIGGVEQE